ncbi:hypothetical protein BT63DRAFT_425432 [Microthyrium microscopicum]|uniref:Uncharacterized protein n=1 Tax=Microthyrium microscopicum TaxID=703497 RepID=A0A6A6UD18_9PEZI|nr:hypothetical protein BT63DRAFT_425432 [Microthyrium microscopicum]
MPSDQVLSSLSAYLAGVGLPIALAGLGLTDRGANLLNSASRWSLTTWRPSQGKCENRLWDQLEDGPLHNCTQPVLQDICHRRPHVRGSHCWESGLTMVLNHWKFAASSTFVAKPRPLPVQKAFLRVDFNVILAFIFMAARHDKNDYPVADRMQKRTFLLVGATLNIQQIADDVLVLHLEGSLVNNLTKDYAERLFKGYPPLRNDPKGNSVFNEHDEKRGGWIMALGLQTSFVEEDTFLPVYTDCVYYKDRRGHVFWRSMDRVRSIITDIWAPSFAGDPIATEHVKLTVRALEHIYKEETESGVSPFHDVPLPNITLSNHDQLKIITHFNGPPLIADSKQQQFRMDWEPLLQHVLVAAVKGSIRCIAYFKNSGRELEHILPIEKLRTADLYLRGC